MHAEGNSQGEGERVIGKGGGEIGNGERREKKERMKGLIVERPSGNLEVMPQTGRQKD